MDYKIEEIGDSLINHHYLVNGIRLKISAEMIQDLKGPFALDVEEHIIAMYKEKVAEIRHKKLEQLLNP